MRFPSTKTLDRAFPGCGRDLRRALTDAEFVRSHPAAVAWVAQCYNAPKMHELRLFVLNAIAGTHGVEAIFENSGDHWPEWEYLNTGDMYTTTIIRNRDGRYMVGDIGSIIERMPQQY